MKARNQCDGCVARAPFNHWGHHKFPDRSLTACSKHKYDAGYWEREQEKLNEHSASNR